MTMALPPGTAIPELQVMYFNRHNTPLRYNSVLLNMLDTSTEEERTRFERYNVKSIVAAPKYVPQSSDAALLMGHADSVVDGGHASMSFGEVSPVCMKYNMAPPELHAGFSRGRNEKAAKTKPVCTPIALRRTVQEMPGTLEYDRAIIKFPGIKAIEMDD